jgi:choice-of-anchor B domain-containing protein
MKSRPWLCLVALALGVSALDAQTTARAVAGGMTAFGTSVALGQDEIFVGRTDEAPGLPMPPARAGAVHVFRRGATGWAEAAAIGAGDGHLGDGFGHAIALDGATLVVGAPRQDSARGAAYVFERRGTGWTRTVKLRPADVIPGDEFGTVVAVGAGTLLVSAPGRDGGRGEVRAYRRSASGEWVEAGRLAPAAGDTGLRFGTAVALDGDRALVGAPGPTAGAIFGPAPQLKAGAVYAYVRAGDAWREEGRIAPTDTAMGFGAAVALEGNQAIVTAPITRQAQGVAFRFERGAGGWTQTARLAPDSAQRQMFFGASVAIAGRDVLVGAPFAGGGGGAVFVMRPGPTPGAWAQAQRLTVESVGFGAFLGVALTARGDLALAGAPGADFFEGTGYLYARDAATSTWREAGSIVDATPGLEPIVGGERRCENGRAGIFDCSEVDLVAFLPIRALGGERGIMVNDLWGWTDPETNREYALVGRVNGTAFVDVTDAANPVYLGELPLHEGARPNLWRDIKVYRNHAFIVSDGAGPHGMQVFDLTQLRNVRVPPVVFTETAHYDRIHSAHNIVINEETGFAYPVGNSMGGETCGGALHMVDIRDPRNPKFAGCYADPNTGMAKTGYTHDAQCVVYKGPDQQYRGREICFNASESALGIADVTDKASPKPISYASYPNVAYAHQGWLSDDHRYFYLDDEGDEISGTVPRTRTIIFDVADLDDPVVAGEYLGETAASDHNLYVKGNYVYESNYVAGLRILDISDPTKPVEVGYFDTAPFGENVPGFAGTWSNYPFFKSGTIVVSSMREGLFILRKREQRLVP